MDFKDMTPADIISGSFGGQKYADGPQEKSGTDRMLEAFEKAKAKAAAAKKKQQKSPGKNFGPKMGMITLGPDAPPMESKEEAAIAFMIGMKMATQGMKELHRMGEILEDEAKALADAVEVIRDVFKNGVAKRAEAFCEKEHEHDAEGNCLGPKEDADDDS